MDLEKNLPALKFVSENSDFVRINPDKLEEFCEKFKLVEAGHWRDMAPFDFLTLTEDQILEFILIIDSLAFCYWGEPKWTVDYNGQKYDGFYGTVFALRRAIEQGHPILDPRYRANMSESEFADIFRANVEIPLLAQRYEITRQIAQTLLEKYDGKFAKVLEAAQYDTFKILDLLYQDFPSFEDVAEYKEQNINFAKRATLLISDLKPMLPQSQYSQIKNTEHLLGKADYKVPQTMRKFGILEYTKDLAERVDNKIELAKNSPEEIEIRANQLWVIQLIYEKLKPKFPGIVRNDIDNYFWVTSQTKSPDDKPYHRVRTIAY